MLLFEDVSFINSYLTISSIQLEEAESSYDLLSTFKLKVRLLICLMISAAPSEALTDTVISCIRLMFSMTSEALMSLI